MLSQFIKFHTAFKDTELWLNMEDTIEDSPWHREENCAVHTQLAIDYYINDISVSRTDRQNALTLLSVMFHDTGKPGAKSYLYTKQSGVYTTFKGHELISARIWENYAVENWNTGTMLKTNFDLVDSDIYLISWVIENHLFYNFKDEKTLQKICNQVHSLTFDYGDLATVYYDQIIADQVGRISDKHEENIIEAKAFVKALKSLKPTTSLIAGLLAPEIVIMIGASGSGKTSYSNVLIDTGYSYFSLDASRLEYALLNGVSGTSLIDTYTLSHRYCDEHKDEFRQFADSKFYSLVNAKANIVIDNTSISIKARRNMIQMTKKRGYNVVCVLFPISLDTLITRKIKREDKNVPITVIMDQYRRIEMPWLGSECDEIDVVMSNVQSALPV